jgi:hypothetical protein
LFTDTGTTIGDIGFRSGVLVAGFGNAVENYAFTGLAVSAIPEPETYALAAGGASLALALYLRRRRRTRESRLTP